MRHAGTKSSEDENINATRMIRDISMSPDVRRHSYGQVSFIFQQIKFSNEINLHLSHRPDAEQNLRGKISREQVQRGFNHMD